ncbi:hypothetical protein [Kineothrix sedimenti]|uniref:Uncharacterized protein n=1 Tax=Kineothrix sedimenti TaxID=3123317 RepID=A0ABZ3F207_9FIRM
MNNINQFILKVCTVSSDDWFWLYINGEFTGYEGHGLEPCDFAKAINEYIDKRSNGFHLAYITGIDYKEYYINQEYAEDYGCPQLFGDIPEDMFL